MDKFDDGLDDDIFLKANQILEATEKTRFLVYTEDANQGGLFHCDRDTKKVTHYVIVKAYGHKCSIGFIRINL